MHKSTHNTNNGANKPLRRHGAAQQTFKITTVLRAKAIIRFDQM